MLERACNVGILDLTFFVFPAAGDAPLDPGDRLFRMLDANERNGEEIVDSWPEDEDGVEGVDGGGIVGPVQVL